MTRSLHPCAQSGCGELLEPGRRRCTEHARGYEQARGSRQERGYDAAHDRERRRWATRVRRGDVLCARCKQPIERGERWALDHRDDRTGYLGPSHERCNNQAGGRRAHDQSG